MLDKNQTVLASKFYIYKRTKTISQKTQIESGRIRNQAFKFSRLNWNFIEMMTSNRTLGQKIQHRPNALNRLVVRVVSSVKTNVITLSTDLANFVKGYHTSIYSLQPRCSIKKTPYSPRILTYGINKPFLLPSQSRTINIPVVYSKKFPCENRTCKVTHSNQS